MDISPEKKKGPRVITIILGGLFLIAMAEAFILYQSMVDYGTFGPMYKKVMEQCPCWCPPSNNVQEPELNFSCYGHFPWEEIRYYQEGPLVKALTENCDGGRYNESE